MIFLDSTFLIAIIFSNDKYHHRAMELRKMLEYEKKIINNTVLNEVLNCLDGMNDKRVKRIVEGIYNIGEIYYLSEDDYKESLGLFHNYDHSINFSDCTILESMVKEKVDSIISFDSDFRKINGLNVIR